MRHEVVSLAVPAANSNGAARDIRNLTDLAVYIDATLAVGSFSVVVEGKISGVDEDTTSDAWVTISGAITGTELVTCDRVTTPANTTCGYSIPFTHLRLVATTMGGTPPQATVAGRNPRTH